MTKSFLPGHRRFWKVWAGLAWLHLAILGESAGAAEAQKVALLVGVNSYRRGFWLISRSSTPSVMSESWARCSRPRDTR